MQYIYFFDFYVHYRDGGVVRIAFYLFQVFILEDDFHNEVPKMESAFDNIKFLLAEMQGVKDLVSVHNQAFGEIDHYIAEIRKSGTEQPDKAVLENDKIVGLLDKVETLSEEVKTVGKNERETHRIVMTQESLTVLKKMQEEIEYLQGRMLDAYSLKDLDKQM